MARKCFNAGCLKVFQKSLRALFHVPLQFRDFTKTATTMKNLSYAYIKLYIHLVTSFICQ